MKPRTIDQEQLIDEEFERELHPHPGRVKEEAIVEEVDRRIKERTGGVQRLMKRLRSVGVVAALIGAIVLIGTLYDALYRTGAMMQTAPLLGMLYLLLIFALVAILGYSAFSEYLGYRKLKRIERMQERGRALLRHPSKEVYSYARTLIRFYQKSPRLSKRAETLEQELEQLLEAEVLGRVEERLLAPLDAEAKKSVVKYANQTAISTAISPVALIDAFLILSRSYAMINEIAQIYGYRPNFVGEIALIKRVFVNLAFASITDILAHHSHDILGSTLLSKLSLYSAQGLANGILTARVGLSTIQACRPLPSKEQGEGFLRALTKRIIEKLFLQRKT